MLASHSPEYPRAQINNYFIQLLPQNPKDKDNSSAVSGTIKQFPKLIDYYIRYKENNGDKAVAISEELVKETEDVFIQKVRVLVTDLKSSTQFYNEEISSYAASIKRVNFLKQVIENNDGYRVFYIKGKPVKREADLQLMFRLTWYAAPEDVNSEVNNGRGSVDYKISRGSSDSTLVEFKLASNPKLRQNLENQVEVYKAANQTKSAIKVIMCFTFAEMQKVIGILNILGLSGKEDVVLIDASNENKESASVVKT